jgi:hypothetical protein
MTGRFAHQPLRFTGDIAGGGDHRVGRRRLGAVFPVVDELARLALRCAAQWEKQGDDQRRSSRRCPQPGDAGIGEALAALVGLDVQRSRPLGRWVKEVELPGARLGRLGFDDLDGRALIGDHVPIADVAGDAVGFQGGIDVGSGACAPRGARSRRQPQAGQARHRRRASAHCPDRRQTLMITGDGSIGARARATGRILKCALECKPCDRTYVLASRHEADRGGDRPARWSGRGGN